MNQIATPLWQKPTKGSSVIHYYPILYTIHNGYGHTWKQITSTGSVNAEVTALRPKRLIAQ